MVTLRPPPQLERNGRPNRDLPGLTSGYSFQLWFHSCSQSEERNSFMADSFLLHAHQQYLGACLPFLRKPQASEEPVF